MTQEALKLALDYLESRGLAWNVQIALREALREHAMREVQRLGQEIEQEPVDCEKLALLGWQAVECSICGSSAKAFTKPEQEPVAIKRMKEWIEYLKRKSDFGQHMKIPSEMSAGICWELAIELEQFINTTPPQRTWVGLTDDEENEYNYLGPDMHWVIQEIAAKLKERNT